ncbi:Cytochrome oxidase Cu insertion factor, SCO1/SenC/PrrC family [Halpernia humi]|uniref:Cytochrome oxidase Cu insertion factor, SCO1/SenC/PrrC family n=1 Tax=Halpernia humi TaxID=493375 RepID=A0A1H5WKK7_9FLAO|nr:TlpA disulfide reductase family protein [Halpernia humi]SEF99883.1 Cytochrome oxidase Cu insertion factor, SCO1/SenC/PrrC family [Halpernia humi]
MIFKNLKNKINFSTAFKFVAVLFLALFMTSCSKKVEIKGQLKNANPLDRIEFIESSGVATLPLVNLGVDKKGNFEGSFQAPKNGMYIITYGGKQGTIYLKGGEKVDMTGDATQFPAEYAVTGAAKNNNDFLKNCQVFLETYATKINMGQLISKPEPDFLKQAKKIQDDLFKNIEENAKKYSADKDVVQWKKDELTTSLLGLLNQYEVNHGQSVQDPSFKVSKNFTEYQTELNKNVDRLVENHPQYRNYLLGTLGEDFQKYSTDKNKDQKQTTSQVFSEFLKTKKDLSQTAKDYLLAYVIAQTDLNMSATKEENEKVDKLIESDIKNAEVKKDLKKIQFVLGGLKDGDTVPENSLVKADGSKFSISGLKGKPTLVMFYASWNRNVSTTVLPMLEEEIKFYKSKMNFVYVNFDDSKEQFVKTSTAMFKGLPGTNAYAEGGMNSEVAKNFGIYGFKLPGFLVLDKDGKIAGHYYVNLGDPEITATLNKVTGLNQVKAAPQMPQQMMPQTENAPKQEEAK